MDSEDKFRSLGWIRIVLGAVCVIAPRFVARLWTGEREPSPAAVVGMRGLGARDVGIGAGLVLALERGAPVRGWLEASTLADAVDVVSSLSMSASLPRRLLWAALAGSGVYMGVMLAPMVDELED